ncbi:hypothetical protein KEM48_009094 [Puccinia striiformis f. sp. tritici PST-130]|nr:hypothetical protein KEM48_009094 [Puccinia striiformis f. sp. tritici PST-130]
MEMFLAVHLACPVIWSQFGLLMLTGRAIRDMEVLHSSNKTVTTWKEYSNWITSANPLWSANALWPNNGRLLGWDLTSLLRSSTNDSKNGMLSPTGTSSNSILVPDSRFASVLDSNRRLTI